MDLSCKNGIRFVTSIAALLAILLFVSASARAQDQLLVPSSSSPPPMKFIPSPDRAQISVTQDAKSRVKASLLLAETRLLRAEQFTVDLRFIAATSELGVYQAIIEDTLRFLGLEKAESNKTRDLFKRLEIQLRTHSTRIEAIRRVTPSVYAVHIAAIWDFSDRARAQALNGFFNDKVMPEPVEDSVKDSGVENSKVTSAPPSKKQ